MDIVPHKFFDRVRIVSSFINSGCRFQVVTVDDFCSGWLYSSNTYLVNITMKKYWYLTNSTRFTKDKLSDSIVVNSFSGQIKLREGNIGNTWLIFDVNGRSLGIQDDFPKLSLVHPDNFPL